MTAPTEQPKIHIHKRPPPFVGKIPFEGDLLQRQPLADRLTGLIQRLNEGAVIGITGDWGDGKTWFGRNWRLDLDGKGFRTFYIDAFEHDFSEDAFLSISSEIIRGVGSDKATETKLLNASKQVGTALLPIAAKVALSAGIRLTTGLSADKLIDTLGDKLADASGVAAEKLIERRLKSYEETKSGVQHFRATLQAYCGEQTKPVVFFIDELDRCRPTFAVQVIERIKHFFDVDNLVFILLLNRSQLEASIRGVYGPVNAPDYLTKFVHFFLRLPTQSNEVALQTFAQEVARRYGYALTEQMNDFISTIVMLSPRMNLSLRDIERIFILLGLTQQALRQSLWIAAWVAVIKTKRPDLFDSMKAGDNSAYSDSLSLVENVFQDSWYLEPMRLIHRFRLDPKYSPTDLQKEAHQFVTMNSPRRDVGMLLPSIINMFDLPKPE